MSMALPRLPSGVYFDLLASSTVNKAHYIREYPTFPTSHGIEEDWDSGDGGRARHVSQNVPEIRQFHNTAHHASLAVVDPDLHRSAPQKPQKPQPEQCLPIVSVAIDMQVDCNVAKTKVVQTFTNHSDISIPEAWYSFPLYDGAVIMAFRCEVGDDKVLEGKVKPKAEAKRMFKLAVKKQEAAALVEEMTPEVFQTTIGNIEPRTTVKVEITYVEELHFDLSGDGIVVTIPTSVAPRYGTTPVDYRTNSAIKETGLSLVVSVASPRAIGNITCRSGHGVSVEYGKMDHLPEAASFEALVELQRRADSRLDPKHATIRFSNTQTVLDRDVVLFIPSPDGSFLRSQALLAPPSGPNHAAMMVTVRPSDLFSDLREAMDEFEGEVLFLADRSGSMQGPKITELKDALLLFLKSLPEKCRFNLYSFGSTVSSLWSQSMPYDNSTVHEALEHISTFQADFGGTEVLEALKKAVDDRRSRDVLSTQIILLTDGEIWQTERTIDFVRTTTLTAEGSVRFFSLGIGTQVSHQLIQGIGFFGGGFGETIAVDAHGKWKEAVIRMLKGAIMPESWSYSISFGNQWREKRLDVDDFMPQQQAERNIFESLGRTSGATDPSFIQAPRQIPRLHHFTHQSVYFLIDIASGNLPDQVIITACSQYSRTKTATLAVIKATANDNAIQHLAAKAAVRDLENQDTSEVPSSDQIRNKAEQLCQLYSITSKWTSFVAISHPEQSKEYKETDVNIYKAPLAELDLLTRSGASQAGANLMYPPTRQYRRIPTEQPLFSMEPAISFSPQAITSMDEDDEDGDGGLLVEYPDPASWAPTRGQDFSPAFPTAIRRFSEFVRDEGPESDEDADGEPEEEDILGEEDDDVEGEGGEGAGDMTDPKVYARSIGPGSSTTKHAAHDADMLRFPYASLPEPELSPRASGGGIPRDHILDTGGPKPEEFQRYPTVTTEPQHSPKNSAPIFHKSHSQCRIIRSDKSNNLAITHDAGAESSQEPNNGPCAVGWREVIRYQRVDGLFHLEKDLGHLMGQHFCPGTRQALKRLLEQRMYGNITSSAVQRLPAKTLLDTVMTLAYIRSHFYSQRALWDMLVQKAEGRLTSMLKSGQWAR